MVVRLGVIQPPRARVPIGSDMGTSDLNRDAEQLRDWLADRTGTRWWVRFIEPDCVVACSEWSGDAVKLWARTAAEALADWPARLEAVSWPLRTQARCG